VYLASLVTGTQFKLTDYFPGGYLKIDLIGKNSPHFQQGYTDRYYCCLHLVRISGTPVGENFF
jgi:hypothetical protein